MASSLSLSSLLATTILLNPFCECFINWFPMGFGLVRKKHPVGAAAELVPSPITPSNESQPPPDWLPGHGLDTPFLISAGADRLHLKIYITMKNQSCPTHVDWIGKDWATYESNVLTSKYICVSNLEITNLNPNTRYTIIAKPVIKAKDRRKKIFKSNWYGQETRSTETFPAITALTCLSEVPTLRGVRIHSMSESWVALSWLPPADNCLTQYKYYVRHRTKAEEKNSVGNSFQPMGTFWSDHVWHSVRPIDGGGVVPCSNWPDRLCLVVLSRNIRLGQEYVVEVYVNRTIDNKVGTTEKRGFTVINLVPGPPEKLFCMEARPTALELRWSYPLSPGGILKYVHVLISTNHTEVRHWKQELNELIHPTMYNQTITGLQPSTCYNVSVWFVTTTRIKGERTSILVWTTPAENQTTMQKINPATETTGTVDNSTRVLGVDTDSQELSDRNRQHEMPWIWIAACAVLVVLIFVSFLLGHRCGTKAQWEPTLLKNSQSSKNIIRNPPVSDRSKVKTISYEVSESAVGAGAWRRAEAGDRTALCAAGAPPSRTAPVHASHVPAYAEVDPASGRAWMGHHYEEPPHGSPCYAEIKSNSLYAAEKPYATVGDPQGARSPACYSPVQRPPPPPPPPPPAADPSHEYAQVLKKGDRPAPSASATEPPPAVPARFPLTDCDQ